MRRTSLTIQFMRSRLRQKQVDIPHENSVYSVGLCDPQSSMLEALDEHGMYYFDEK